MLKAGVPIFYGAFQNWSVFFTQETALGGLSYKVKKPAFIRFIVIFISRKCRRPADLQKKGEGQSGYIRDFLNDRASHSRYFSDELDAQFFVKKEHMFTE